MDTVEQKIEYLLENSKPNIHQINELIPMLEDELSIHGQLSSFALESAYQNIDKLNFSDGAKEHIMWFYYDNKRRNLPDNQIEEMIERIISDFKKYKYFALECPLIEMLIKEKVPEKFTQELNDTFDNTEISKHLLILSLKKKVKSGYKLSMEDTTRLFNLKAFDFLEFAMDMNAIEEGNLTLFREPRPGEDSRKAKQRLYNKAQSMKTIESK